MRSATASASSEPVVNPTSSIGPAAGSGRSNRERARRRLSSPSRASSRSGSLWLDEPMRGIEDRLPAAVVVDQHDARRLGVCGPEAEDVAERGAAEAVDALVVVAHDGDVAVRLGQELHQLPLCVVRVLELVDQDVAISRSLLLEHGGVIAQEPQREGHLVAEVEPISRAHEPLVGGVRRRQLGCLAASLAQRLVVRRVRQSVGQHRRRRRDTPKVRRPRRAGG